MLSLLLTILLPCVLAAPMPLPWTRELLLAHPTMSGRDVTITQQLLLRDDAVSSLSPSGKFDQATADAVTQFQTAHALSGVSPGVLDALSAAQLLALHGADGVVDSGFTAKSLGYLYKIHVPVYRNRSIETNSTLFDADGKAMLTFPTRTHGFRDDGTHAAWPDFGNGDVGLNEFSSDGATVTGIVEIDLNSPEPDPASYGPYPINRLIRGLQGNGKMLLDGLRSGLLLHTGNWTVAGWDESQPMPNSEGCIHTHPKSQAAITQILDQLGVVVRDNPFSSKDYPYDPQGVMVIQLMD